ncbi:MAG: shikimate dehydrogenase [Desulfobacterota bacterium]|nr:shikimate dehydrogenase [Thermodesulfobacteriota bacterium]
MTEERINAQTILCCLIGNPVEHSLSPALHNACFRECGLNWVYVAFRVTDIAGGLAGIRALGIRGASVTIPYKISALKYLDDIDPVARTIGSINTIVNQDGCLIGFNSDGTGALQALREQGHDPAGKRILVLGSGGAARAICVSLALHAPPQILTIMGIVQDEMVTLERDLRTVSGCVVQTQQLDTDTLARILPETDIVINCTPVGMYPNIHASPIPAAFLKPRHVVFDVVYNPLETRLLLDAQKAGAAVVPGIGMFINQAAVQFQLWTGREAPRHIMHEVVMQHLRPHDQKSGA